jgi:predicted DNA-binding transcriptional regulator AlpA
MNGAAVMRNSSGAGPEAGLYSLLASEYLDTAQVAAVLAVSKLTLARWRVQREGPPFLLLKGGTVRYPKAAFEAYLRSQLQRQKDSQPRHGGREVRWSRAAARLEFAGSR